MSLNFSSPKWGGHYLLSGRASVWLTWDYLWNPLSHTANGPWGSVLFSGNAQPQLPSWRGLVAGVRSTCFPQPRGRQDSVGNRVIKGRNLFCRSRLWCGAPFLDTDLPLELIKVPHRWKDNAWLEIHHVALRMEFSLLFFFFVTESSIF